MQKQKLIRKIKRRPLGQNRQIVVAQNKKPNMFGGWTPQKTVDLIVPHKILQKFKQTATLSKLPPMISVLNTVAVRKGFLPIGVTSIGSSSEYIGRYWDRQAHTMLPFPKQPQKPKATINISQNFNYYTGRAINKWNQFVQASQQLQNFSKQVNTPQKQQKWTQKKIQQMSLNNQIYKWVTTLFYAYVFPNIPMQSGSDISQQQYKPPKANILCLNMEQMKQIWKLFLMNNKNSVQIVYDKLTNLLTQFMNKAHTNKFNQKYKRIATYLQLIEIFTQNTSFYLAKQGLPPDSIKQILAGGVNVDPSKIQNFIKTQLIDYLNASKGGSQSIQTIVFRFPLNRKNMDEFPEFNIVGDDQFKSKLKGLFDLQTYGMII